MKIVFYSNDLGTGGAERVMSILANTLVKKGHEVSFLLISEKDTHEPFYNLDDRIQVIGYRSIVRINNIKSVFNVVRILKSEFNKIRPDVVVCFFTIHTIFASLASVGKKIKVIYSQRTDPYSKGRKDKFYDLLSAILSNKTVCQSECAKKYYPSFVRKKISVIKNPIEIDKLPKMEISPCRKEIVSVGRLVESKNYKMLINAFKLFLSSYPDYILRIYGEGPDRQNIENQVEENDLHNKVMLMGNDPNVLNSIVGSSLFVMCSQYEGLPNALIEAMCVGLPCISTDYSPGGIHEIISQGENGIIIPRNDVERLSKEMKRCVNDEDLRKNLSRQAIRIKDIVDSRVISQKWIDVLTN